MRRDRCLGCADCARICAHGALETSAVGYRVLAGGKLGRHPRLAAELLLAYALDDVVAALAQFLSQRMQLGQPGQRP